MSIFTPELERYLTFSAQTALRFGSGILAPEQSGRSGQSRQTRLSVENAERIELRDYSTGDDPWRIDWGICARHDELRVRVRRETTPRRAYLLLDASYGMCFQPTRLRTAKLATVALAAGLLATGAYLEFGTFMPNFHLFPVLLHQQKLGKFLRLLDEIEISTEPNLVNFEYAVHAFLAQKRHPGDLYVLSDCFGESDSFRKDFETGFRRLQRAGFSCRLIHLTNPDDRAENFTGDVDIWDPSRSYRQTITLTERDLATYQRLYDAYLASVQEFCRKEKIPYARISTAASLNVLCLTALGMPEGTAQSNPWAEFI